MIRVELATGNAHKAEEVAAILGPFFEVVAVPVDAEETGATFEENALIKARAGRAASGRTTLADDSGIVVDGLDGEPGIHSARWTEEPDWIPKVLQGLEARPGAPRTARYVAAAAVARADGTEAVVRGVVEGLIAPAPQGTGGFGYDPIFVPAEGDGRTFAEMTAEEKHALSHRGRAFRALAPLLDGATS